MMAPLFGSGHRAPGKKAAGYNIEWGFLKGKILLGGKLNKLMISLITSCIRLVTSKGQKAGKVRFLLDQSMSVVSCGQD